MCGGGARLNLYKLKDGATAVPAVAQPTGPDSAFAAPAAGWESLGCWFDPVNPRALSGGRFTDAAMTPAKCAAGCDARGFAYAGTEVRLRPAGRGVVLADAGQFGGECFCSNTVIASMKVSATDCKTQCKGDAALVCGAAGRLNLYHKTAAPALVPAPTANIAPASTTATTSAPTKTRHHHHHHRPGKSHARRMRFSPQRIS